MLRIEHLRITYGNAVEAVRDLSLDVPAGGIVALLGANGAGKSTVLKAISGVLAAEGGRIAGGDIAFEGASLRGLRADDAGRRGIGQDDGRGFDGFGLFFKHTKHFSSKLKRLSA